MCVEIYGKADNGNKMKLKWKWKQKNEPIAGAVFPSWTHDAVLCEYSFYDWIESCACFAFTLLLWFVITYSV